MDPLRKLVAGGLPVFGSCAGMIMLADRLVDAAAGQQTFGGIDMTVRRNAFGRQVESFERQVTLDGEPFSTQCSSARRGWSKPVPGSPCWAKVAAGSSPSGRVCCWQRHSTRN
jgi:pyridoxal 5'-phosphate synthase pdxT subunit